VSSDEARELSESAELTEATATTGVSCEVNGVKFNNKNYEDWVEALVALRLLVDKNKNESTSGWYRADVILEPNGSFSLRCSSCEIGYSIKNPANVWSTHKKSCPVPKRGTELTRGVCHHRLHRDSQISKLALKSMICVQDSTKHLQDVFA
jgi:hypothetical protein